tara:strand:+ start:284 stop:1072 length:789 start_codon:yes stop_codon:yes gene_type:complete
MKTVLLFVTSIFISLNLQVVAQTATNFTEEDCNSNSHTLFDELDEGKIIVIAWVMPCGSCSYFGSHAYDAVQTFTETHPGKVEFYLTDDYANTSCSNISSWGNANNMENHIAFSSEAISMSDYGTNGMPKVVVLAGNDHAVLYNENNGSISFEGVLEAITSGLNTVGIGDSDAVNNSLSIFPNPSNGLFDVEFYVQVKSKLEVFTVLGEKVVNVNIEDCTPNQKNKINIDLSSKAAGLYLVNLSNGTFNESQIITIENALVK